VSPDYACHAYAEGTVLSGNPLEMVVALYEGTIEAVRRAKSCLITGDTWGRAQAISKAVKILTELLVSLDHTRGGEVSQNLKRLYSYMQCRLLDAHSLKSEEHLNEVERLLLSMLEGWRGAADKMAIAMHHSANEAQVEVPEDSTLDYGAFTGAFCDDFAPSSCISALF
jgi:flagellar secretion chaperone FliS